MKKEPAWRRYQRLWGRDPRADIEDELSFHMNSRVGDLIARGHSEAEARALAERAFGDVAEIRTELRRLDQHHHRRADLLAWLGDMRMDMRLGYRGLRRKKVYAGAVIATLALGIAASTAIFALVNGLLLRPLPYPDDERLVVLWERNLPRDRGENVVSVPNFEAWLERARSYEGLAALVPSRFTVAGDTPERIYGAEVSPEWFGLVGVAPHLGRGFTAEEGRAGSGQVIVLSDELWARRFNRDPAVVGRPFLLEGEPYTVVGVMPAGFDGPRFGWLERQEFWVPFRPSADNRQWGRFLLVLGRLREGVDVDAAQLELRSLTAANQNDPGNLGWSADVITLREQLSGGLRAPLLVLLAAVSLLQLIALVNVTSLVLARAQERDLEFSVRTALGAGRVRLLRQLLAEALALISLGAPLGILLGIWLTSAIKPLLPPGLIRADSIAVDGAVLGFAATMALVTFLTVGLLPIARIARVRLETRLRESNLRVARSNGSSAIVIVEVALALMLSVGAGLAIRSFNNLQSVDLGFSAEQVTSLRLALPRAAYDSESARAAYFAHVIERVGALPGVQSVAAVNARPLNDGAPATTVQPAGAPVDAPPTATIRIATMDYFRTMGMPLRAGRSHDANDRLGGPRSFVISRSLANAISPNQNPLGQRIIVNLNDGMEGTVVGIVDDVRFAGPRADAPAAVYMAHSQWPMEAMDLLVRSALPLESLLPGLRSAVWSADRTVPIQAVNSLSDIVREVTAQERVNMLILGMFALLALVLAGTGIYGVLAIDVGRRQRELGIRMSLGAQPNALRGLVLARAAALALAGILLGTVSAYAATRFMRSMLSGVSPTDPATFALVAAVMFAVALAAAYLPARRATRSDPLIAIRSE